LALPLLIASNFANSSGGILPGAAIVSTGGTAVANEVIQGGTTNATPTQWFNSGPSPVSNALVNLSGAKAANISGPVTSIVADPNDPNILYITTAGGGAWKTNDGGVTWIPLFDNHSSVQAFDVYGLNPTTDSFSINYTDPFTGNVVQTPSLQSNATPEQIQAALNQVVGAGNSVSVTQNIKSTAGVNAVQQITLNTNSTTWQGNITTFELIYNGQSTQPITYATRTGVATTDAQSDAAAIQSALDALVGPGNTLVTATKWGPKDTVETAATNYWKKNDNADETFTITFLSALGLQPQNLLGFNIGGPNAANDFWTSVPETPPGDFGSPNGQQFPTINSVKATPKFNPTQDTGNLTKVTAGVRPGLLTGVDTVQQITLNTSSTTWTTTAADPVHYTRFQLSFQGVNTADIPYTGNTTQDAANIQNALNASGFLPAGGSVTVAPTGNGPDESFLITFLGTLALSDEPAVGFNIGGTGHVYWSTAPAKFPTIDGVVSGVDANNVLIDNGSISVVTSGNGPTLANTITFGGGKLANQNVAPITFNIVNNAVVDQSIGSVLLTSGTGYTAPIVVLTDPAANGSGANATVSGTVTNVGIVDPGAGYTSTPTVTFSGGGGAGATGIAVLNNGQVISVIITSGGNGYTTAPTVTFNGGSPTTAAVAVSTLSVTAVTVTNGGTGYGKTVNGINTPVNVAITESFTTTTASFNQPAIGSNVTVNVGSTAAMYPNEPIYLQNGGFYTVASISNGAQVVLKNTGVANAAAGTAIPANSAIGGSKATAIANLAGGATGSPITSVTVTSGAGYTSAPTIGPNPPNVGFSTGPAGSGAIGATTVSGTVTAVTIPPNPTAGPDPTTTNTGIGAGYFANPDVTIVRGGAGAVGAGTGATATAQVDGYVRTITVNGGGSGYTAPVVHIAPPTLAATTATFATQATATASISGGVIQSITVTYGGQGYDYYNPPLVTVTDPSGSGATFTANIDSGVFGITLSKGYTGNGAGNPLAVQVSGGGGSGATATPTGSVTSIPLPNTTQGFTVSPIITFIPAAGDTNSANIKTASAEAYVDKTGKIVSVAVINGGSGYTLPPTVKYADAPITVPITAASEASGTPSVITFTYSGTVPWTVGESVTIKNVTPNGYNGNWTIASITPSSNQFTVNDNANLGLASATAFGTATALDIGKATAQGTTTLSITGFVAGSLVGGLGYTSPPTITFPDSTGTGASGIAAINAAGQVTGIQITSGSGYGSAPLVLINTTFSTADKSHGFGNGYPFLDFPGDGTTGATTYVYFNGTQAEGAIAVSTLSAAVASAYVTVPGSGYTLVPTTATFSGAPTTAATATVALQTTVLQTGSAAPVPETSGNLVMGTTSNVLFYATGEANQSGDSYFAGAVYESVDYGRTWKQLLDPTLQNLPSPGNPLYGLVINKIVPDTADNVIYVAAGDVDSNGLTGNAVNNAPYLHDPGVWRYNLNTDSWFNLTDLASAGRLTGPSTQTPATKAPGANAPTPGPDDNFSTTFSESNTSWTDIALSSNRFIAAGNPFVLFGANSNGTVYYLVNPQTADDSNNSPQWYAATPGNLALSATTTSPAPFPDFPQLDNRIATGQTAASPIRLQAAAGATVYAAVGPTNGTIEQTTNGGVSWSTLSSLGAYGTGSYSAAMVLGGGTVYVAGNDNTNTPYVYQGTTNITTDANGNSPHTEVHALAFSGGILFAGTDGGVWKYANGLWTDITGNLAVAEINGLASSPTSANSVFAVGRGFMGAQYTGAQAWNQLALPSTGGTLTGNSIAIDSTGSVIYEVQQSPGGNVYVSTNSGATWSAAPVAAGTGNAAVAIDTLGRVFLGGVGLLWRDPITTNWSNLGAPSGVTGIAVAQLQGPFVADPRFTTLVANTDNGANGIDRNTVYITNGTTISLTKDFGLNWKTVNFNAIIPGYVTLAAAPFNSGNVINDIEVDPSNRDHIYAVVGGSIGLIDTGTVWQSTDAGQTWTEISTGLPATVNKVGAVVTSPGAGYSSPPLVTVTGGGGIGATAIATIAGGQVTGIVFTSLGTGYTSAPTITLTGGGFTTPAVVNGAINGLANIDVTNGGSGYLVPPTVTISGGGGTGATAVATILNGVVTGITLTNAGSGFTSMPTVTLSAPPAGGTTATAVGLFGSLPAWKLALDSRTGLLYLATDNGVYQYTNGAVRTWVPFGANLPQVAVHALDLNPTTNILTAGTYGRSAYQFYLDTPTVNSGALYAGGGSDIWNGPIILAGPTTISAPGNQALQNGTAQTQLFLEGIISDQTYAETVSGANTLTKIGGGNVIINGPNANIYTGTNIVQQGNLVIQNPLGLGGTGVADSQSLYINNAGVNNTKFTLSFNGATSPDITYTGNGATDAAAIASAINNLAGAAPTTTGGFTQPADGANVTVPVGSTAWMTVGQTVYIVGGGYYTIAAITDGTDAVLTNLGVAVGNVAAGTPIAAGANVGNAFLGKTATVTPDGTGAFLVTFPGVPAGVTVETLIAAVTVGTGSAYAVNTGGTVVADGAILQLKSDLNGEPLSLFGNGVENNGHYSGALENVSGSNTYTGTITLMTNSTIGVDSTTALTITSPNPNTIPGINDLGSPGNLSSLTKEGTGSLSLASTNTYEGGTFVNQGILDVQNSGALGLAGTTTTVLDLAQLQLEQTTAPVIVANENLVLSGSGPSSTGALLNVNGNNTFGGPTNTITLTSAPAFSAQSLPGGVPTISVLNPTDTLTIGGKVVEPASMVSVPSAVQINNPVSSGGATGTVGLNEATALGNPPDTNGAAGPSSYVETANQTLSIFKKTDGSTIASTPFTTFFSGLAAASGTSSFSDPVVIYDDNVPGQTATTGRFIVLDQNVDAANGKSVCDIAVSKTATPGTLTAADWYFFQINNGETGNLWADYPGNLGYNADAFVVTFNVFDTSGNFQHGQIVTFDINALINNTALVPSTNYFLTDPPEATNGSLRPATMHDAKAGDPMWFVQTGGGSDINVIEMPTVLTATPTFVTTTLSVSAYANAVAPLNPDGSNITPAPGNDGAIDDRIDKAAEAGGTIVAAHTISVSATQDDIRWYAIDVSGGTPTLKDQGDVSAGNNTYLTYPSIDINPAGDMGLTYIRSGTDTPNDFMSMYVTGRLSGAAAGTMATPLKVPKGTGTAKNTDNRAGDLSGINVDPVDGTFWAANEFTPAGGKWSSAIANFQIGSGATPATLWLGSGLTKIGAGTLTLTQEDAVNGLEGTTYVKNGILDIQKSKSLGRNNGNAVQRVTVVDPGLTDTFKLTFNSQTTGALSFRSTAPQVQAALNALSSINANGVTVAMNEVYSGISQVESLTLTNPVTGATPTKFNLTFNGSTTTTPVTYTGNAATDALAIRNALNGLASIGGLAPFSGTTNGGSVTVTADATDTIFTITFGGELQDQVLSLMTAGITSPTGTGTAATAIVHQGSGVPTDVYTITFTGAAFAGKAVAPITVSTFQNNGTTPTTSEPAAVSSVAVGGVAAIVSTGAALYLDGDPTHNGSSLSTPIAQSLILNGAGVGNTGSLRNISGNDAWNGTVMLQTGTTIGVEPTTTLAVGATGAITNTTGTGASPIVVTSAGHGLKNGQLVTITGARDPNANGTFLVGNVTTNTFALFTTAGAATTGANPAGSGGTWSTPITDPSPAPAYPASLVPPDLTKVGAGTLIFPGANTYSGNTYVNSGVLNIRNPSSLGVNTATQQTVSVSGSGTFTLNFTGYPAISTGPIPTNITVAGLQFDLDQLLQSTSNPALGGGSGTVNVQLVGGNTFVISFGGTLAGQSVPLLVAPPQNFVGGLSVSTALALTGASSGTFVASGATLQLQNVTEASGKPLTIGGPGFQTVAVGATNSSLQTDGTITSASGAGGPANPIIIATDIPNRLVSGNLVTIAGVAGFAAANGSFTVTVIDNQHFSLNGTLGVAGAGTGGMWSIPTTGALEAIGASTWNDLPITLTGNTALGADTGASLNITQPINDNGGNYRIYKVGPGSVEFSGKTGSVAAAAVGNAILSAVGTGGAIEITTVLPSGLVTGSSVTIAGNGFGAANGPATVTVIDPTHFLISTTGTGSGSGGNWTDATVGQGTAIQTAVGSGGPIEISTSVATELATGDLVTISGITGAGASAINGQTFTVERIDASHFTLDGTSATVNATGGTWSVPIVVTTTAANGLASGNVIDIGGNGLAAADGTFTITALSPTQFALNGTGGAGSGNGGAWGIGNNYTGLTDVTAGTLLLNVTNVNPTAASPALAVLSNLQVGDATPVSQVQTLTFGGTWATGDTYTLTYNGNPTATITYDANPTYEAALIQAALNQASVIGVGNTAIVTPVSSTVFKIALGGGLAGADPANLLTGNVVSSAAGTFSPAPYISTHGGPPTAGSAIARLLQSNEIPTSAVVNVNSDGLFDINGQSTQHGQSQTIAQLNVIGGTVTTNLANGALTGTLNVSSGGVTLNNGALLTTPGNNSQVNVTGPLTAINSTITTPGASSQVNVTGAAGLTGSALTDSGNSSQFNVTGSATLSSSTGSIANAARAAGAPIVVTTTAPETLATGQTVAITGNGLANTGPYVITVIDPTHFSLNGTSGAAAAAVAGGTWTVFTTVALAGPSSALTVNGPLTETDATVTASGASSAATVNGALTMTGGAFDLADASSQLVIGTGGSITANSDVATGSAQIVGPGTLTLNVAPIVTVNRGPNTTDLYINAPVAGNPLTKTGAGRLEFGPATTYADTTTIEAANVQVDGGAAIGDVVLDGTSTQTIKLAGFSNNQQFTLTFGSNTTSNITYTNTGAPAADAATNAAAIQAQLNKTSILGVGNTATVTPTATANVFLVTFGGNLTGTNVAALTGAPVNPATGTVTASLVNASLSGNGTVGAITMANANATGIVNPGVNTASPPVGALTTTGDVTWDNNSTFWVDLTASNGNDMLNVTGDANLGNALLTGTAQLGIQINQSFTILTYTGSLNGSVFNSTFGPILQGGSVFLSGQKFMVDYSQSGQVVLTRVLDLLQSLTLSASPTSPSVYGQDVVFKATAVPEPGAAPFTTGEVVNFVLDGTPITGAVNGAGTITIDTGSTAGLIAGTSQVTIAGVGGDTAADGTWVVSNVVPDTSFDISATGNDVYTTGGVWSLIGQTVPLNTVDGTALFDPQTVANFTLPVGAHTVDASFDDINAIPIYASRAADNGPLSQTVGQNSVNLAVSSNPASPTYGQTTTVSANVTPALVPTTPFALDPTSTVAFNLDPTGSNITVHQAVNHYIQLSGFTSNSQQFTLNYGGAPVGPINYNSNGTTLASAIQAQLGPVVAAAGTTTLANVANVGPNLFQLTFADGTNGAVMSGATGVGGASVLANVLTASWTIPVADINAGNHDIKASYDGDTQYQPSATPKDFPLQIAQDSTSIQFNPDPPAPSNLGATATFNVTILPGVVASLGAPGGYVSFYDGAQTSANLLKDISNNTQITVTPGAGQSTAQFNVASLVAGQHNIIAVFTDTDGNYLDSTQTSQPFTVNPAPTAITFVTESPSSPTYGQPVQFTVNIAANPPVPAVFGAPAGNITLWDGAVGVHNSPTDPGYLGVGAINPVTGQATITTTGTALSATSHTILAYYAGNTSFKNTTGTLTPFTVAAAATSTLLVASPPSGDVYGQPVTLNATVSSAAGAPPDGSSVAFYDGDNVTGTLLGTRPTVNGKAFLITTALTVNTGLGHTINAYFTDKAGDTNFGPSTGTVSGYNVGQAQSSVTISALPGSTAAFGTAVKFTVIVSGVAPGGGAPTNGTVTLTDSINGVLASNLPLFSSNATSGTYVYTTSPSYQLSAGTHTIVATFSGDTNLADHLTADTNDTLSNYVVTPAATSVSTPTTSDAGAVYGEPVTFSVTVSATGAPNPTTGTVTFSDSIAGVLGTVNVGVGGAAQYTTNPSTQLSVNASHKITATFTPSATAPVNYQPSLASGALTQAVVAANTLIGPFTASPSSPGVGTPVTLTAYVSAKNPSTALVTSATAPGSTITFKDTTTSTTLGTVAIDTNGAASKIVTFAAVGTHNITAVYNGFSPNFNASPIVTLAPSITVIKASTVTASVVANATSGTTYGQNLTFNITIGSPQGTTPTAPTGNITAVTVDTIPVAFTGGAVVAGATSITIAGGVLNAGAHSFVFTYGGDSNYYGNNSAALAQSIAQSPTKVAVTTPPTTDVYGVPISVSGVVTANPASAPAGMNPTSGTVKLYVDAATNASFASVSLVGNTFSFPSVSIPASYGAGAHSIIAVYSAVPAAPINYATSPNASFPLTITKGTTATVVTAPGPNSPTSTYGQPVIFSAVVTATAAGSVYPPFTGAGASVNFYDLASATPGTPIATITTATSTLNNTATYTFTTSTLSATGSPHKIAATYIAAGSFASSPQSAFVIQNVNKAGTTAVVTSSSPGTSPNYSSYVGQSVQFTATVSSASGVVPFTGTGASVTFYDNGAQIGSPVTTATIVGTNAVYKLPATTTLSVNAHPITAIYTAPASANFTTSLPSAQITQTVNKASTQTTMTSPPTAAQWADDAPTTFTITVALTNGTAAIHNGVDIVSIFDNTGSGYASIGTATFSTSTATTATYKFTTTLPAGANSLYAQYSGNASVAGSDSSATPLANANVRKTAGLKFSASSTSPTLGTSITFTATLTGVGGVPITGVSKPITFTINGIPYTVNTNPATGVATFTYTPTTTGAFTITASLTGDSVYNDVFANPLTINVLAASTGRQSGR
jgi:autotransporter-associated beta strand protein